MPLALATDNRVGRGYIRAKRDPDAKNTLRSSLRLAFNSPGPQRKTATPEGMAVMI